MSLNYVTGLSKKKNIQASTKHTGVDADGTLHDCLFRHSILYLNIRGVSVAGNRQPILTDRVPAVAMISWHVARHWAAGPILS